MMKNILLIGCCLLFQTSFAQVKTITTIENGYLVIKVKLSDIDLTNNGFTTLFKNDNHQIKEGLKKQEHFYNVLNLLEVLEIYEELLIQDNKMLSNDLNGARSTLKIMKIINSVNSKNNSDINSFGGNNIDYSFGKISRINSIDINYSFDKISRIGDTDIFYSFDKVSRIGDVDISYAFGRISKIGNYDFD